MPNPDRRLAHRSARAVIAVIAGAGFFSAPVQAQTAASVPTVSGQGSATAPRLSFDAASIRQSKPGAPIGLKVEHGRLTSNLTLGGYIEFAWDLMSSRE